MILISPRLTVLDRHGRPLSGGQVYTYEAGSTTPKTSYSDPEMITPHAWPLVLNSDGKAPHYVSGSYKLIVKDQNGVTVESRDNLWGFGGSGVQAASGEPGQLVAWDDTGEGLTSSDLAGRAIQFPEPGTGAVLPEVPGRSGRIFSFDGLGRIQLVPMETFIATVDGSEDWGDLSPAGSVDDWGSL